MAADTFHSWSRSPASLPVSAYHIWYKTTIEPHIINIHHSPTASTSHLATHPNHAFTVCLTPPYMVCIRVGSSSTPSSLSPSSSPVVLDLSSSSSPFRILPKDSSSSSSSQLLSLSSSSSPATDVVEMLENYKNVSI